MDKANEPIVVILLGSPGSGKGTQAAVFAKRLGIPHISTGDLFRDNLRSKTTLGNEAKSYLEAGKLVPDEVVLNMLFARVLHTDCSHGYLLDGFPRTIPQAEALDVKIAASSRLAALNLEVADELIMKRIEGRLNCKQCGNIHNKYFLPPKKEGICDKCGGELYQRSDDREEVIKERLKVYHDQTEPLIAYYTRKGVLANVDGENAPKDVSQDLMDQFNAII
jgi:adenylate kinase